MERENQAVLDQFFARLQRELGEQLAEVVVEMMVVELGSVRLTFPSLADLERQQRNRRIQTLFNGANLQELALRFDLHPSHVRRILSRKY